MKYFYAHIFSPDDIHKELEILDITDEERNHLVMVVESTMHHAVVDALLSALPEEHKGSFLDRLTDDDHDGMWNILHEHVDDPESKVTETVEALKAELLADIKEAGDISRF